MDEAATTDQIKKTIRLPHSTVPAAAVALRTCGEVPRGALRHYPSGHPTTQLRGCSQVNSSQIGRLVRGSTCRAVLDCGRRDEPSEVETHLIA